MVDFQYVGEKAAFRIIIPQSISFDLGWRHVWIYWCGTPKSTNISTTSKSLYIYMYIPLGIWWNMCIYIICFFNHDKCHVYHVEYFGNICNHGNKKQRTHNYASSWQYIMYWSTSGSIQNWIRALGMWIFQAHRIHCMYGIPIYMKIPAKSSIKCRSIYQSNMDPRVRNGIFTYIEPYKSTIHVGKCPMDPMGYIFLDHGNLCRQPWSGSSNTPTMARAGRMSSASATARRNITPYGCLGRSTGWWQIKDFLFSPLLGEKIQID